MSILDRSSLEDSSLADLHAIASELSIDSFRRLRKAELIDAILSRQSGEESPAAEGPSAESPAAGEGEDAPDTDEQPEPESDDAAGAARRRRTRRGGRSRSTARDEAADDDVKPAEEPDAAQEPDRTQDRVEAVVEGVVEVLPGGSGFVRVNPPDPSDDDVYISGAQVRRCELVSGDRVSGPRRAPRRSERFASLIRVETVNGRPAEEVSEGGRFDDLPASFPNERLPLQGIDATVKGIIAATPLGLGSRVTITGPAQSGKTESLRRIAAELTARDELQVWLVLTGARPEETTEWAQVIAPAAGAPLGASVDVRSQALEGVVEPARRMAARGANAVVLADSLDHVHEHVARRALASARNIRDGGSLTVIGTASRPLGGETTVIAHSAKLAASGRFPPLDVGESWTMRAELLVGEKDAEKLARARARALGS